MEQTMTCDVLVIGGGIAACFAAVKAQEAGASVIMVDKGYVGRSGQSPYADSFLIFHPEWGHDLEASMATINRHSEYLNDQYWTRSVCWTAGIGIRICWTGAAPSKRIPMAVWPFGRRENSQLLFNLTNLLGLTGRF